MQIYDKKPKLFEKTEARIWTDPYIQQQLLKEHLNPDTDGASRRKVSVQKTVDLIIKHTAPGSRLLDLGCGPGLYTSLLKDKGYIVTGIDFNEAAITYARTQRKDICYLTGDYIQNYPKGEQDAIIMIYCDMGTHTDNDRDNLLANIYQSLSKDGVLIFDIFSNELATQRKEEKSWEYESVSGLWSDRPYLLLSQTFHYPQNHVFAYQYNLLTEDTNKHFILWERYYSKEEITLILKKIGFSKITIYDNLLQEENNFISGKELFIIAQK